jgi:hypothetical protein
MAALLLATERHEILREAKQVRRPEPADRTGINRRAGNRRQTQKLADRRLRVVGELRILWLDALHVDGARRERDHHPQQN